MDENENGLFDSGDSNRHGDFSDYSIHNRGAPIEQRTSRPVKSVAGYSVAKNR